MAQDGETTGLKKASSSYQKGGSKYEAGNEPDATRYTKVKKEQRTIKNFMDNEDTEGRPVSNEYDYKLYEADHDRHMASQNGSDKKTHYTPDHK